MKFLAFLIGWFLLPFFAIGSALGRLVPGHRLPAQQLIEEPTGSDFHEFAESYERASRSVVNWWLHGEGYTLDNLLASESKKEIGRDLIVNLMNGVREGFIDPEFARCLTYALSCAAIQHRRPASVQEAALSPAWPCEYCVFFKGLTDVLLPEAGSDEPGFRQGNKLGHCEKRGTVTMREMPAGVCKDFTVEKRSQLRLLKQTNEELQLWYLVYGRKANPDERSKVLGLRKGVKEQILAEAKKKRKRRVTDYSLR